MWSSACFPHSGPIWIGLERRLPHKGKKESVYFVKIKVLNLFHMHCICLLHTNHRTFQAFKNELWRYLWSWKIFKSLFLNASVFCILILFCIPHHAFLFPSPVEGFIVHLVKCQWCTTESVSWKSFIKGLLKNTWNCCRGRSIVSFSLFFLIHEDLIWSFGEFREILPKPRNGT